MGTHVRKPYPRPPKKLPSQGVEDRAAQEAWVLSDAGAGVLVPRGSDAVRGAAADRRVDEHELLTAGRVDERVDRVDRGADLRTDRAGEPTGRLAEAAASRGVMEWRSRRVVAGGVADDGADQRADDGLKHEQIDDLLEHGLQESHGPPFPRAWL